MRLGALRHDVIRVICERQLRRVLKVGRVGFDNFIYSYSNSIDIELRILMIDVPRD